MGLFLYLTRIPLGPYCQKNVLPLGGGGGGKKKKRGEAQEGGKHI